MATTGSNIHWNYFLALESDLAKVGRYIEFCDANGGVYSTELARLLFAASSEVDVLAKLICKQIDPRTKAKNINDYCDVLLPAIPDLPDATVGLMGYGIGYTPWKGWAPNAAPIWWKSYNKVKHKRDAHFNMATLENAVRAMCALLILNYHYYARKWAPDGKQILEPRDTTNQLYPDSKLLRLHPFGDYYYSSLADW